MMLNLTGGIKRFASYRLLQVPIWYIVEQRVPPNLEWTRVEMEWRETSYKAKVDRRKDYYWRVRACNEVGMAEPSMPASLRKAEGRSVEEVNTI